MAALSRGAAVRPRRVDRRAVDAARGGRHRIRAATTRRRSPPPHPATGVRAGDSPSPVRCPGSALAPTTAGLPGISGVVLPRRARGVVPPSSGGSRAGMRNVQHGRFLQCRDVSQGSDRRAPATALPRRAPPRSLRRRNRSRRRSLQPAFSATTCMWAAGCRSAARS